ncbi:DUF1365 domain-containing protein [Streptomyces sp. NPDC002057]|uniref:DUF1365 domain-containing protein n=1 Tax=Streptomyces sp. NPDC002057 TaxID=3154664 RepID=UPI003319E325
MTTHAAERAVAPTPAIPPRVPALYLSEVAHARVSPVRYGFRHRTYFWLVDLDALPRLPRVLRPLARFDPRDHFDGTAPTLRAALDGYLASQGVRNADGRVLMLGHARVLGYVFNPLTLYWCHDRAGRPVCVVAEVHNTYGGRHCYLLRTGGTDASSGGTSAPSGDTASSSGGTAFSSGGTASSSGTSTSPRTSAEAASSAPSVVSVAKEFYVSPFFDVEGWYRMRLPLPDDRLDVTVQLCHDDGTRPLTATVRGRHRPATARALLGIALRRPWSTAAVSLGIRLHGIRLYLKGLRVRPRPPDPACVPPSAPTSPQAPNPTPVRPLSSREGMS